MRAPSYCSPAWVLQGLLSPPSSVCWVFAERSAGLHLEHKRVCETRSGAARAHPGVCLLPEIEMVIMERSKLPELAASTSVQEQNTTDEENSAATGLDSVQWSRYYRPGGGLPPSQPSAAARCLG